jgi:hypothetical protein
MRTFAPNVTEIREEQRFGLRLFKIVLQNQRNAGVNVGSGNLPGQL